MKQVTQTAHRVIYSRWFADNDQRALTWRRIAGAIGSGLTGELAYALFYERKFGHRDGSGFWKVTYSRCVESVSLIHVRR